MNERKDTAFDARLRQALDISTPELTPDPETWVDIKSRMQARGPISRALSRNGFLPTPVSSFGAIAAAAVLALFVLTDTRQTPTASRNSDVYVASVDTARTIDSIAMHAQLSLSAATDSLLHHVGADSLSQ